MIYDTGAAGCVETIGCESEIFAPNRVSNSVITNQKQSRRCASHPMGRILCTGLVPPLLALSLSAQCFLSNAA